MREGKEALSGELGIRITPSQKRRRPPSAETRLTLRKKKEIMERLSRDGIKIAEAFHIPLKEILPERGNVKSWYGTADKEGGIRIRLWHAERKTPLKYSSLVNTLCHELAHLRHFHHGEEFKRFYFRLLAWAKKEGIYRPSSLQKQDKQLSLW